jgi:rfaE bifunctional protein kinase chain/domain
LKTERLEQILLNFNQKKLAVFGDFFLDLYIHMDRTLSELSLETRKEAFQATKLRGQPGAAGVVTSNLAALGGQPSAFGFIGQDGFGYTLKNALALSGTDTTCLIETNDRFTPTYTKPIMKEVDGVSIELNRIDIINRTPNPPALNDLLVNHLEQALLTHDGILILEQVSKDGCGAVSPLLRDEVSKLAAQYPQKVILVDSRHFGLAYRNVALKTNLLEAISALHHIDEEFSIIDLNDKVAASLTCSKALWDTYQKPIFITLGEVGISGIDNGDFFHHPGFITAGPIDIVGAGDSVLAGIGLSLCAGASPKEAAYVGNLVGSVIVQQIGTTGLATQEDVRQRHVEYQNQLKG